MTMKKYLYLAPALLAASSLMLTGCSDDDSAFADGQGSVTIKATLSGDVKVESRTDADELRALYGESLTLWLTKPGQGPVRQYQGLDNLPTDPVTIPSGSYVAEAWAGDSVSASFDSKYFKGYLPFEVTKGTTTPVDVTLKIANVVVSVDIDDSVDEVLQSGYTLTAGHSRGTVVFEGRDTRKAYFMMPSTDTDLTLTLDGVGLDGKKYTQTETIADAQAATEYVVHISHNPGQTDEIGGGYFNITVDATEIEVNDEFVLTLAPDIKGIGFNIAEPQSIEQGKGVRKSVYVTAADRLTSLVMESDAFESMFATGRRNFDLLNAEDNAYEQTLAEAGITIQRVVTDGELTNIRINFEETYTASLAGGTYAYSFTARDGELESKATFTLDVTNAPVAITGSSDVTYTTARLSAAILKEGQAGQAGFNVRPAAGGAATFVAGTIEGGVMTATAEGLTQNTAYSFTAVYGGFETVAMTFTTLAYPQLPNAGFEYWSHPAKPYLIYASGQEMFWDSGNHGSTTLSADASITTPDATVKHSGQYSAKLASAFVGVAMFGKLAAGNIFTGQYLKTDGTNGELGWGRPFTSPVRPKALRGYVKYNPVAVTHAETNPAGKSKGDMDEGIIYIALLTADDDTRENTHKGWPVVIRTKEKSDGSRQLFDQNAANVIAYGEKVFTSATPGDGMIEFTIDLTDVHGNLDMAKILVVASASRYGDYFTGGNGSTMWLDDLELVY